MKTRSWFEPEKDRIVVLDLEGSESEGEGEGEGEVSLGKIQSSNEEYKISKAYFSRLRRRPTTPPALDPQAGALVLYKPIPFLPISTVTVADVSDADPEKSLDEEDAPIFATEERPEDGDVEMMDVDES